MNTSGWRIEVIKRHAVIKQACYVHRLYKLSGAHQGLDFLSFSEDIGLESPGLSHGLVSDISLAMVPHT
jgi:hypothetical protein